MKPTLQSLFAQIRSDIARDEMPAALSALRGLLDNTPQLNEILQQSGRVENIYKQIRKGTISQEEATREKNRIRIGVLELLTEIEKDSTSSTALSALLDVVEEESDQPEVREEVEKAVTIVKIKDRQFLIIVIVGCLLVLIALLAIGIWQKDAIIAGFRWDRFFKSKGKDFKILVMPFKQVSRSGGENYDAGDILTGRLVEIAQNENLKIKVRYWPDYHFEDYFSYQTAKELQEYHRADMLIYGSYQTSDYSARGDKIRLNYVTAEKWNLGKAGSNCSINYQPGGIEDLEKGKIQEKVENIPVFISLLVQIKSLDRDQYLKNLQGLLNNPNFSSDSKLQIYLELADKLIEEGKLREPLIQYNKVRQIATDQNNKEYQGLFLKRIGDTYSALGNLKQALAFFEQYNDLAKELHLAFPQNPEFKNELAISYRKLGSMHSDMGNLNEALTFFGKYNDLEKELNQASPKNQEFKNALAVSYDKLGVTHSALGHLPEALKFFKEYNDLEKELHKASPKNVEFKDELGVSYERLGNTHNALGHLKQALAFFERYNRLGKELYADYPENVYVKNHLAISFSKLGETHSALGSLPQALRFFAKSIDLERELHQTFPQNVYFKNHLAISFSKLGETHRALGNLPEALNFFEKYNDLAKELYKAFPQNVEFKNALAISYQFLGITHSDLDSLPQALAFFKQYNKLEKELYDANPENVESKNALAVSYSRLGETYRSLGNLSKALIFFEKDVKLTKELLDASPQNVEFKNNLAISYEKLGDIYSELDNLPQALAFFGNETRLFEELSQAFPNDMAFKNALVFAYARLGKTHIALGNLTQALTFFKKYYAIAKELYEAFPQDEFNKSNYAESLSVLYAIQKLLSPSIGAKDLDKAIQLFKELNKIDPEYFKNKTAICYKMKQTNADLKQLILEMSAF